MLVIPPTKYRGRRRPVNQVVAPPTPSLVLQYAAYDSDALTVLLGFDRQIDVSAFDGSAVTLRDGSITHRVYAGGLVETGEPNEAVIYLIGGAVQPSGGPQMTATAGTGIVALDDGATWPGVVDLTLPFGE